MDAVQDFTVKMVFATPVTTIGQATTHTMEPQCCTQSQAHGVIGTVLHQEPLVLPLPVLITNLIQLATKDVSVNVFQKVLKEPLYSNLMLMPLVLTNSPLALLAITLDLKIFYSFIFSLLCIFVYPLIIFVIQKTFFFRDGIVLFFFNICY